MRSQQARGVRVVWRVAPLLQQPPGTVGVPALRPGPDTALLTLRATQADRGDHRPRRGVRRLRAGGRPRAAPLPYLPVLARAGGWVDGEPVCSTCAGIPVIARCPGCQRPRQGWRGRRCPRCELAVALAELRGGGDPDAVAALEPLLGQLERHQKPLSAIAWLERSPAAPTFRAMLLGEIAISHDTLDQHDVGQATAYLRSWLVAHHVLARGAPRPLRTLGTTRAAGARRSSRPGTRRGLRTMEDRGRLRPEAEDRTSTPEQPPRLLRQPACRDHFTRWLHDNYLALEQTRQAHVD